MGKDAKTISNTTPFDFFFSLTKSLLLRVTETEYAGPFCVKSLGRSVAKEVKTRQAEPSRAELRRVKTGRDGTARGQGETFSQERKLTMEKKSILGWNSTRV